jgi:hypothetical protein
MIKTLYNMKVYGLPLNFDLKNRVSRGTGRSIIGEGGVIFIYSCSA